VAPAIKYLPSKHKAFSLKPTTEKLIKESQGMIAQACDPHTWETEIGGLSMGSLSHAMTPCQKNNNKM
jgi:hypothetical protein